MKISELPTNERAYFRALYEQTELIVGGYENNVQDGHETETPTVTDVASEARAEVEQWTQNGWGGKEAHFIGRERMDTLARIAARRSLRDSIFADSLTI